MSRKVMQQALDALENHAGNYKLSDKECAIHEDACAALRSELENPDVWQPMTDGQIDRILFSLPCDRSSVASHRAFARLIEANNRIKT